MSRNNKTIEYDPEEFKLNHQKTNASPSKMAEIYGMSVNWIYTQYKILGLPTWEEMDTKEWFERGVNNTNGQVDQVAKYLGINDKQVYERSYKYGIKLARKDRKQMDDSLYKYKKEDILKYYEECDGSANRIAIKLGAAVETIIKSMKRYDIERKKPHLEPMLSKEELKELYDKHNGNATAISKDCGICVPSILSYYGKYGFETNYANNISGEEAEFINYIDSLVDEEVISNSKSIIPPYELDCYVPSKKLAFEYNGNYWHSEATGKDDSYHVTKSQLCKEQGIQLIHIFSDEWNYKNELVKSKIRNILGVSRDLKIHARKCVIKEVDRKDKIQFMNDNHIYGDGNGSVHLGLFFEEDLVACASFIKNKDNKYKLDRYATSKVVMGGFSKILSYFIKSYNPEEILTYADLRFTNEDDNVYLKCGFTCNGTTKPGYFYTNGEIRESRQKFMKHKLKTKLKKYDESLTEYQNCNNNGYYRIWDCGHLRYVWRRNEK